MEPFPAKPKSLDVFSGEREFFIAIPLLTKESGPIVKFKDDAEGFEMWLRWKERLEFETADHIRPVDRKLPEINVLKYCRVDFLE